MDSFYSRPPGYPPLMGFFNDAHAGPHPKQEEEHNPPLLLNMLKHDANEAREKLPGLALPVINLANQILTKMGHAPSITEKCVFVGKPKSDERLHKKAQAKGGVHRIHDLARIELRGDVPEESFALSAAIEALYEMHQPINHQAYFTACDNYIDRPHEDTGYRATISNIKVPLERRLAPAAAQQRNYHIAEIKVTLTPFEESIAGRSHELYEYWRNTSGFEAETLSAELKALHEREAQAVNFDRPDMAPYRQAALDIVSAPNLDEQYRGPTRHF